LGCAAQGDDSQEDTFARGVRSQRPEPRPEPFFVLGREPQLSVATYDLNSMNIGAALFGDTQSVSDRLFGLLRAVDGYEDE
jgi:hypothetical protein